MTMSEVTTSVVSVEEQKAREEAKAQALAKATGLLGDCERAIVSAETSYGKGLLEAGRFAAEYVAVRIAPPLAHSRAAAVQAVELLLSQHSSTRVKANDLIGAHHAFTLVGDGVDMAYRFWRDAWS